MEWRNNFYKRVLDEKKSSEINTSDKIVDFIVAEFKSFIEPLINEFMEIAKVSNRDVAGQFVDLFLDGKQIALKKESAKAVIIYKRIIQHNGEYGFKTIADIVILNGKTTGSFGDERMILNKEFVDKVFKLVFNE